MYFSGNQQLSNCTPDPSNKKEIIPGTRNLAKYPGLVTTQTREENLQLPLSYSGMIPKHILNIYPYPLR